jgi:hypothetical protein
MKENVVCFSKISKILSKNMFNIEVILWKNLKSNLVWKMKIFIGSNNDIYDLKEIWTLQLITSFEKNKIFTLLLNNNRSMSTNNKIHWLLF